MRKSLLLFSLLFGFLTASAQNNKFIITGNVIGNKDAKYAVLYKVYDDFIFVANCKIVDDKFQFSGSYEQHAPSGAITQAEIFLVKDTIFKDHPANRARSLFTSEIVVEPELSVTMDMGQKTSIVKGGKLNEENNLYRANDELYKRKLDTALVEIEKKNLDSLNRVNTRTAAKHALYLENVEKGLDIIKAHPASEVAIAKFRVYTMVPFFTDGRVRVAYAGFSSRIKQSKYGVSTERNLTELEKAMVKPDMIGKRMPGFELEDADHKIIKSNTVLGKYTLIEFWATWCAPCRAESPTVKAAFNKYHSKGFNVISISVDNLKDREKWIKAIETDHIQDFTNLFSPMGSPGIAKDLNISAIPANYLLDNKGKVIAADLRGEYLIKKLGEIF